MLTYNGYLLYNSALTIEDMMILHNQMLDSIRDDSTAQELYCDLIVQATKYVDYRAKWHLWSQDEKLSQDSNRTKAHDAFIDQLNILARYVRSLGHSTNWHNALGNITTDYYARKRIGDFACYLIFINALHAR